MRIKREQGILILILILSGLLRIYLFKNLTFIDTDGASYARLGKNLIETGNYAFGENYNMGIIFPPGYPIFIGLVNIFTGDLFVAGKLVSLLASLGTIAVFYWIGKLLYNRQAGLFAALAYAIYPFVIEATIDVQTESLFFLFLALSIYLFILLVKHSSYLRFILLGLFSGFAFLIRPEGMVLLVLPLLVLTKRFSRKDILKILTSFLTFVLIAVPYQCFLRKATGKFMLSGKGGINVLIGESDGDKNYDKIVYSLSPEKDQINVMKRNTEISLLGYITSNPLRFAKRYAKNFLQQIKHLFILLTPIMLGLFFSFFCKDLLNSKARLALLVLGLFLFCLPPIFFVHFRLIFPTILVLILFACVGFANAPIVVSDLLGYYNVAENSITSFLEKNIKRFMVFILLLCSLLYIGQEFLTKKAWPSEHLKAAAFLKEIAPQYEQINVMSRKPWVSFYSNSRHTTLPYASSREVIDFAKRYDVDYVVIDERLLSKWDVYSDLMDMERFSEDVDIVYRANSPSLIKVLNVKR